MIGREFNDPTVQNDIKKLSYDVVSKSNKPHISVEYKGESKTFLGGDFSYDSN